MLFEDTNWCAPAMQDVALLNRWAKQEAAALDSDRRLRMLAFEQLQAFQATCCHRPQGVPRQHSGAYGPRTVRQIWGCLTAAMLQC